MTRTARWVATALSLAMPVLASAATSQALQARDLDGNPATIEAYYDPATNLTWLADANYAYTSGYRTTNGGAMTWSMASTWAEGLDVGGIMGWQLPATNPINGATYNNNLAYDGSTDNGYNISAPGTRYSGSTASEMAHLFYGTLGDRAYCNTSGSCPQAGWGITNAGPFSNVQAGSYWSATQYGTNTNIAWHFNMAYGSQGDTSKGTDFYAWAVHAGDIGTAVVPTPAAAWLFASGLLGLLGVSHKRRR